MALPVLWGGVQPPSIPLAQASSRYLHTFVCGAGLGMACVALAPWSRARGGQNVATAVAGHWGLLSTNALTRNLRVAVLLDCIIWAFVLSADAHTFKDSTQR